MATRSLTVVAFALTVFFLVTACHHRQHRAEPTSGTSGAERDETVVIGSGEAAEKALRQAALDGFSDEVHRLIESGTDINARDEEGHTALMLAAFNGHSSIVLELLENGAGVGQKDGVGRTALLYASTGPFPETVKMLLDRGAEPNLADEGEHFTALMHAAAEGHMEVVRVLLEYGADPSLRDVDGDDAEHFARQAGHLEVAEMLHKLKL